MLLFSLDVLPTLFPMKSCKLRNRMPCLEVTLQGNTSTLDYIMGEENIKDMLKKEADDQEAAQN